MVTFLNDINSIQYDKISDHNFSDDEIIGFAKTIALANPEIS